MKILTMHPAYYFFKAKFLICVLIAVCLNSLHRRHLFQLYLDMLQMMYLFSHIIPTLFTTHMRYEVFSALSYLVNFLCDFFKKKEK